jgi:raffinose/stachyose/melibiose transport system permease protein
MTSTSAPTPTARRMTEGVQTKTNRRRGKVGQETTNWGTMVLLFLCALTVLLPLYVTISMSLKTTAQAVDGNAFSLPAPIDFSGFAQAWELTTFRRAFVISVLITAFTVLGTVVLAALASYAIVRNWEKRFFRWSFFYLLVTLFLPFPVVALPQIQFTGLLGLANPVGVTILHIMFQLSFSILLFTAFLRSIPMELEESARMDGATTWVTFRRLIFPLLAPMSATIAIFAFLASWNDFMMPSLIIADASQQTIPVVQSIFQTQFSNNYNVSFASYLMAMAPAIIAYLFTQRWVMEGLTQGAVKG